MKRTTRSPLLRVLLLSLFLVSGCSDESPPPTTGPNGPDLVTVTGKVIFVYDNIAADGDVRIDLKLDNGEAECLVFASFWVDASEERQRLYARIKEIQIGDRVRAAGQRKNRGIEVEELTILDP